MRVLFTIFPGAAHMHPIAPLAWALQNAGHQVRVLVHPEATDLVTEAGLTAVPMGAGEHFAKAIELNNDVEKLQDLDDLMSVDTTADDEARFEEQWLRMRGVSAIFRSLLPDLVGFCRRWQPDLVLWDPFCTVAGVAARVTGAAHARFLWGQDNIALLRERARTHYAPGEDPMLAMIEGMAKEYDLEYEEEMLLGQWSIDPMPPGLRLPTGLHYEPIRRIPFNGSSVAPDWAHERPERPRVALTLGIGGRGRQLFRRSGVSFPEVVEAVAGLDVELVATVGAAERAALGTVPENVRLVDYIPLNLLLPTCSAVIHHGGGGTFAASVASRVPQLITPMPMWSELTTARYVAANGAGLVLDSASFTAAALRDSLARILTEPSFQDGAAKLHAESTATPGPNDLVPVLENRTARHRR